jgi:hypothetical protein
MRQHPALRASWHFGFWATGGIMFADDGYGEMHETDLAKVVRFLFGEGVP